MADATFIKRVKLKNYRSIASCDVQLGPLNFLVGPNGSGKSNFLDALRLVVDGLRREFTEALADRDGFLSIFWRAGIYKTPPDVTIDFDFALPSGEDGHYGVVISGDEPVRAENLRISRPNASDAFYDVKKGEVIRSSVNPMPAASTDRLYLVNASGLPEFRPVYDAFTHLGIYNIDPDHLRKPQISSAVTILRRDGSNLADILEQFETLNNVGNTSKQLVTQYLSAIIPDVGDVYVDSQGQFQSLLFDNGGNAAGKLPFRATNMSDGTLRALGNLVALFQIDRVGRRPSLVGIEEPEAALHPAAAGVLLDALREASQTTQVIVTSHSPDLLDNDEIAEEQILAVASENGATKINHIDEASRSILKDRLFTPGELLRLNQLQPESPDKQVQAEASR